MKKLPVILWILFWGTPICFADNHHPPEIKLSVVHVAWNDIMIGFQDARGLVTSPANFSQRDWLIAATGISASMLLMTMDKPIRQMVDRNYKGTLGDHFPNMIAKYGQIDYAAYLSLGMYGIGLFAQRDDLRLTGRMLTQGLIYTSSAIILLRCGLGRIRPYQTEDPWNFKWFNTDILLRSFPSSHASTSFVLSTILSYRLNNRYMSAGLYSLALMIAILRVYQNQHWFSDVVVGSVLGIGASRYVIGCEKRRYSQTEHQSSRWRIAPARGGLRLSYRF